MQEIIFVVEQAPESALSARALGASIFTWAETVEELHARCEGCGKLVLFDNTDAPQADPIALVRDEGSRPEIARDLSGPYLAKDRWSAPSNVRGGVGGSGSGTKARTDSLPAVVTS